MPAPRRYQLKSLRTHGGDGDQDNVISNTNLSVSSSDANQDSRMAKNFLFETLDIVVITIVFGVTMILPAVAAWYSKKAYEDAQQASSTNPTIDFGTLVPNSRMTFGLIAPVAVVSGIALLMWVWRFLNAMK